MNPPEGPAMSRLCRSLVLVLLSLALAPGALFVTARPALAAVDIGALADAGPRPGATRLPFTVGDSVQAQVDVGSGNLMVTVRGLSLHAIQSPVVIGAWYNSAATQQSPTPRLGKGWGLDYTHDVRIVENADDSVTVHGPGGLVGVFPRIGTTNSHTSAPGWKSDFARISNGTFRLTDRNTRMIWRFSAAGNLTSVTDRNGNLTYVNAGSGSPVDITVDHRQGPTDARIVTVKTASEITTVKQPNTATTREVQFKHVGGLMTEFRDPLGRLTSFGYDSTGLLTSISAPGPKVTTFTYTSARKVATITQQNGNQGNSTTRLRYPSGVSPALTQVADPTTDQAVAVHQGPHTAYTLDSTNRVTKAVDPEGRTRSKTYTPNFDTASSTNGTGTGAATTTNTFGANNGESLTKTTSPTGASSSLSYANTAAETAYLPTGGTDAGGTSSTYTYNGAGNQLTSTDAAAAQAKVTYNTNGTVATATSPANGTNDTTYGYTNQQVTSITPVTGSSLGARTYSYDQYGRLATATNGRGITTTYTYDAMDRQTKVAYSDGTEVSFGYDQYGNQNSRIDQWGTTTWSYDQMGRLLSRENTAGGGAVTYTYNKASWLTSTTTVGGGTVTYQYDDSGTPSSITYPASQASGTQQMTFTVDTKGRRTHTYLRAENNNSLWRARIIVGYDQSDRPTTLTADRGTGPNDFTREVSITYCYAAGSPTTSCSTSATADRSKLRWRKDNLTGAVTTYTYDTSGRLTQAAVTGTGAKTFGYGYNSNSNRTTASKTGSATQTLTFNPANQISTSGYTYDGAGNLTAKPGLGSMTYTAADQLKTVNKTGAGTYEYRHAGIGNNELIYQTTEGQTPYRYTYGRTNPQGLPIIENVQRGTTEVASVTSDPVTGQPLMLRTDTTMQSLYVNENSVGSPIGLLTTAGTESFAYDYDPYGMETLTSDPGGQGAVQNPYLFASGLQDRNTGWVKFGARYYDPITGTFTQQDTLDAPLDPKNGNRYAYAANDPVNITDPTGRDAVESILGGAGLAAGSAGAAGAIVAGGPYAAGTIAAAGAGIGLAASGVGIVLGVALIGYGIYQATR